MMSKRFRVWLGLASASLGVMLLTCSCAYAPLFEEERTVNAPHVADKAVKVNTVNGSVSVEAVDRSDVQITAKIRAISQERLEATQIVVERTGDQALSVAAAWPEGRRKNREGCSFEVLLPGAQGAELRSSNGALEIKGLKGQADLRTSNGKVSAERHAGSVTAESSNGAISMTEVGGAVEVKTSNGSIRIALASDAPGPINARTSNGSITLQLSPAFFGELEIRTSNGSLDVADLPGARMESLGKHQARLLIGDSGQKSSARTSNGSIRVRSR